MDITKELGPMLDAEDVYIEDIKSALAECGESITDKAEHDLRIGYRTARLIDIQLQRHQRTHSPTFMERLREGRAATREDA